MSRRWPACKRLVVIAATWGEGEPPARAARVYAELMGEAAPRLDGIEFGVLALGDTAYAEFCAVGKALDERLQRSAASARSSASIATSISRSPRRTGSAARSRRWRRPDAGRGTVIEVDFGKPGAVAKPEIVEAEIIEHIDLNSSRSDKETIHLALAFDGAAPAYEPGDSLDLYAENDPAEVDELLKAAGLVRRRGAARRASSNRATSTRCR